MKGDAVRKDGYCYYVVSDIHYLSPRLYDQGSAFWGMMKTNDGKLTEYGEEIVDEFIRSAQCERPDGVILTGDLTFNGELQSLLDITGKFRKLNDLGIPVYMISGNHDIGHRHACSYHGENKEPAEKISPDVFLRHTSEFGRADAVKDQTSGSYIARLQEKLYLLALDANMPDSREVIPGSTLEWADEELAKLPEGSAVIGLTHQNVLRQNNFMKREILNREEVKKLYGKYGIRLNLSGHAHLQHISEEDGLKDICTECLMISPLQYGVLNILPEGYSYTAKKLGILEKEAAERLDETVIRMITPDIEQSYVPSGKRGQMERLACELCAAVFAGKEIDTSEVLTGEAWNIWETYAGKTFWYSFLKNILMNEKNESD